MYQRREEHVDISEWAFRIQEGGHGYPNRRPAEPDEPADKGQHTPSHALAGQRREGKRFAVLPLLRYENLHIGDEARLTSQDTAAKPKT